MQSTETYTRRENARRAGVAAGVPKERVAITVHKEDGKVRFGWQESLTPVKTNAMATGDNRVFPPIGESVERNGVKRPKAGGLCAAVWEWLDANVGATVRDAKAVAAERGWNTNNVSCEFYQWRRFNGITGRTKAE